MLSEGMNKPFDEGIKNFAYSLIKQLSRDNRVLSISICEERANGRYFEKLKVNRLLLSYSLYKRIRDFSPEVILYVPSASASFLSFLRSRILKFYIGNASVVMVGLQPVRYSTISKRLLHFVTPDLVLVQSRDVLKKLSDFGCRVRFLASGVDMDRFRPVNGERKLELKRKYKINPRDFLVLHVGHLNRNRNVQFLKGIQGNGTQMLLVGSTSTQQDKTLVNELRAVGVRVITDYVDNVQEIYQAADCYVFQVVSGTASIEVPLSVLEAMACNLPVVTTGYGGLPVLFREGNGLLLVENTDKIPERIAEVKQGILVNTRSLVEPLSWDKVAGRLVNELRRLESIS